MVAARTIQTFVLDNITLFFFVLLWYIAGKCERSNVLNHKLILLMAPKVFFWQGSASITQIPSLLQRNLSNTIFQNLKRDPKSDYPCPETTLERNHFFSPKWSLGDMVWILKDLPLHGIWSLGRITATHPGKDGVPRVYTVKTAHGTFERPAVACSCVCALTHSFY